MKSGKQWKLLVATVAALATSSLMAQIPGHGQAFSIGGESPNDPTRLLASESVQKELKLTDEQKAGIQKLFDDENVNHPFFAGFAGLSREQIQKRLQQHAQENHDRVAKILTRPQADRLNQINIQISGIAALNFDDVAEKLNLTPEQRAKLKDLAGESRRKLMELNAPNNGQKVPSSQQQAYQKKLMEITAERGAKTVAVLTEEQRTKFKQLEGDKFDISTIRPVRKNLTRRGRVDAPPTPPSAG